MVTVTVSRISPEEYLERERQAETKSEYLRGEVFAMAGGSLRHALIISNLSGELRNKLRNRQCIAVSSDARLAVALAGLYTYPDVMVICGQAEFADNRTETVINPIIIIEVLSESTKSYDLGAKFHYYRSLPSLMEYLTVAQSEVHIEHNVRQKSGQWLLTDYGNPDAVLNLPSLDVEVRIADIYEKVEFEERAR